MSRAFLSGLGVMGRRHLRGLVRAGFHVTGFDPSADSAQMAGSELIAAGFPADALKWVQSLPAGAFDVAVFAETAPHRFHNVSAFLRGGVADRYLLEKPLSADPEKAKSFVTLFRDRGIPLESVFVNFPRRTWRYIERLRAMCETAQNFQLTVNGGAVGLGCNGIHQLDLFLYLNGGEMPDIRYVKLSRTPVLSGRGEQFRDFGGDFLLESSRSSFFCSLSAESSATTALTVRGNHFVAWVDESDRSWRLLARDPESNAPNYRYGADYRVLAEGKADATSLDDTTESWARGRVKLPPLLEAQSTHDLLDRILRAGGAEPPYQFT